MLAYGCRQRRRQPQHPGSTSAMPELPDIVIYLERLQARVLHKPVRSIRLLNPFLLRSVTPPLQEAVGRKVVALLRLGKRIVMGLEDDLFLVVHLMIAGPIALAPDTRCQDRKKLHGRLFVSVW